MYLQESNLPRLEIGRLLRSLPDLTHWESVAWTAGSFGLVFILLMSTMLTLETFVSRDKYVLVAIVLGVIPVLSIACKFHLKSIAWIVRAPNPHIFLCFNFTVVLIGILWHFLTLSKSGFLSFNPRFFSLIYLVGLSFTASLLYAHRNSPRKEPPAYLFNLANKVLIAVVPVMLLAVVVLPANWRLYRPFDNLAGIAGACLALVALAFWRTPLLWRSTRLKKYFTLSINAAVFLSPFLMMDALLSYDALHYTAYLGSSTAVAAGRFPLIDVFCQYGLSYLVYNFGFIVLPNTYHAAALITTFTSALYILCALVILRKLVISDWAFLILGTTLPFFFWMTYHYGSNLTPSHGGMRYFPIFLVAALLVRLDNQRFFSKASIAALFLAWVWSFEAALYSTFIYAAYLLGCAATASENLKVFLRLSIRHLGKLIGLFAIFVILISSIYLAAFGALPRYDLYLSIVLSYVGSDPFMDYSFFQEGFFAWIPVLTAYFVAAVLVVQVAASKTLPKPEWTGKLSVLFALGVSVGIYCLLSTQSFILKAVLIPFYLLFYWALDASMISKQKETFTTASSIGLTPVFVFIWFILAGVAWSNFIAPLSYGTPNTSVLRHILSFGSPFPADFVGRLSRSCPPTGTVQVGNACDPSATMPAIQYQEFRDVLDRWQGQEKTLLTFHVGGTIMEVLSAKAHTLPLSFSYVEGFSPQLFKYIVDRSRKVIANDLHERNTVILPKNLSELNELDWALLRSVTEVWTLYLVDHTENFNVFRLANPNSRPETERLELPDRPIKRRNAL